VDQVVHSPSPAQPSARRSDLRRPVCVFLIAFGVVKILELADWSRLHRDAGAMLALGSGAVTGLLIGAKTVELLLTVAAVFALVRTNGGLLLGALAGWTAEFALLSVMAAVHGDLGRLIEHGLFCVAFGGLLTMTYAMNPKTAAAGAPRSHSQEIAINAFARLRKSGPDSEGTLDLEADKTPVMDKPAGTQTKGKPGPGSTIPGRPPVDRVVAPKALQKAKPAPAASSDQTRQDLPVRRSDATRQDLPVRGADATRQDLPVRRKTPPADPQPDDTTRTDR
jgi:hypothetical protein